MFPFFVRNETSDGNVVNCKRNAYIRLADAVRRQHETNAMAEHSKRSSNKHHMHKSPFRRG